MSRSKWIALALALGLTSSVAVLPSFAEDKPEGEKPAAEKKDKKDAKEVKGPKLFGYWGKLTTLTPEQKVKIDEIHKAALAEKRKIDDKEEADITAVLTAEQKVELQGLKDAEAAARKAKEADKKKEEPKKEEHKKEGDAKPEAKDGM